MQAAAGDLLSAPDAGGVWRTRSAEQPQTLVPLRLQAALSLFRTCVDQLIVDLGYV